MTELRLIEDAEVVDPALDAAISRALMLRVAAGELPATLRIARPGPSVAFGKRDVVSPTYADAVEAARTGGFEPTERLVGGRAAAFHEDTIHLSHSVRDVDPRAGVTRRFEDTAALVAQAFRELGVDAQVGEIEGEYCPGAHSVNARREVKLMGLGQRVIGNGAHVGGVIVVDGSARVRDILVSVYAALELAWRPGTAGDLARESSGVTWKRTTEAIKARYGQRYDLKPAALDRDTLALAKTLVPEHKSVVTG